MYRMRYTVMVTKKNRTSPKLDAVFYRTEMGAEPVREWLLSLTKDDRKLIGEDISYVQFKWPIGQPKVDHMRGPIWEVRTTVKTRIARVYFAVEGSLMILCHGVIKKTKKADEDDIKLALDRHGKWVKANG
jgi:phage-related protein